MVMTSIPALNSFCKGIFLSISRPSNSKRKKSLHSPPALSPPSADASALSFPDLLEFELELEFAGL